MNRKLFILFISLMFVMPKKISKPLKFKNDPFKVLRKKGYPSAFLKRATAKTSLYQVSGKGSKKKIVKIFWKQKKIIFQ